MGRLVCEKEQGPATAIKMNSSKHLHLNNCEAEQMFMVLQFKEVHSYARED
jgi:hypothetical protein